jgi:arsenate reductase
VSMKILFICRGNIARSQMAEAIFNNMMDGVLRSTSAGTLVGEDRDGYLLKDTAGAENVIESMNEIGIDVSNYMRTQLTPEMLDECDWAIVMAEPETIPDYLNKSDKAIIWEVEDPKGMDLEETSEIRDQIESLVDGLITEFAL